ncbi:MAG: NTP transferase domain-containing protein [Muribaculaceae bacterium]|nr:NTP transferase domain-containing protein [Muribaculaceae bacterium]
MKAMILAAGLGSRLKPLTDKIPKALVEIEGVPMLERVILKLRSQGFDNIMVNVHHFADQIRDFLTSREFNVEISISDESDELLDTGGGIVKASNLLFSKDLSPVLIHNVDILSNADLRKLIGEKTNLLVSDRESSRRLLFDREMKLWGWHNLTTGEYRPCKPQEGMEIKGYAFSGIYSLTYESVEEMKRLEGEGKFPVMDYFLDDRREETIEGIFDPNLKLIDIGKPATLSQASQFIY